MSEVRSQGRIPEIAPNDLSPEQSEVLTKLRAGRGRVPTPFKIWLHSPRLAALLNELGQFLSAPPALTKHEAKIVVLLTARYWQADYVFAMHAREAREAGMSQSAIEALASGHDPLLSDPREKLVYTLVNGFNQHTPASDELFAEAALALGHHAIAEMLALCGYFTSVALAMKLYEVPIPSRG